MREIHVSFLNTLVKTGKQKKKFFRPFNEKNFHENIKIVKQKGNYDPLISLTISTILFFSMFWLKL